MNSWFYDPEVLIFITGVFCLFIQINLGINKSTEVDDDIMCTKKLSIGNNRNDPNCYENEINITDKKTSKRGPFTSLYSPKAQVHIKACPFPHNT